MEVYFPASAFIAQLWNGTRESLALLKSNTIRRPIYVRPNDVDESTEKVQSLHSNNVLLVGGQDECLFDFYYISPRDVKFALEKKKEVEIEPVVRVIMELRLLVDLLERCSLVAEELKPYADQLIDASTT